jgi:mono/diheme cytochrome c family protein
MRWTQTIGISCVLFSALTVAPSSGSFAQTMGAGPMTRGGPFMFHGGKAIYDGVCQACHMANARGAVGAGAYPPLANDPKLAVAGYPVAVILHGQKAMPALGIYLDDRQVADVVNFIRTNFGNNYKDAVKEQDVRAQR